MNFIKRIRMALKFVKHIEAHLEELYPNQEAHVMCKICEKTIEEIYNEKEGSP